MDKISQPESIPNNMHLSTILFDLGSTLLYSKDPWSPIFVEAERALISTLQERGISLPYETFQSTSGGFLDSYYTQRGSGVIEKTAVVALRELMASAGIKDAPETTIRSALDSMYSVTQKNWFLEQDAISTLEVLREDNFRLGIISNTSDDRNAQHLIEKHGLRPYFEIVVTSAGCGIRKPDGRIFDIALNHFQVPPGEVMMVGDTLEADVLGANLKGLYSVWITRRVSLPEADEFTIQPQAVVSNLLQIPILLGELEEDRYTNR